MQNIFRLRKEFTLGSFHIRINLLIAACVSMTVFGLLQLALWQLGRAAEKVEIQRALELELQENAGPIEDIPAGHLHAANPEMRNRTVLLRGEYQNDKTILLLAEFFEGLIGYGVVTPFRLASNDQLVLISRGWTTGILPANTEPDLQPVDGYVEVTAQIFIRDPNARILSSKIDSSNWPLRMRTLEIDVVTEILDETIFPFELRIINDQPGTLVRHWPAVNPDVNQNLSYALQWFAFGLIVLFASILASSNLWELLRGPKR